MRAIPYLLMIPILIGAGAGVLSLSSTPSVSPQVSEAPSPLKVSLSYFSGSLLIFGTISVARGLSTGRARRVSPGRARAIEYYHQVSKEIGLEPYSPRELKRMKQEERASYNSNESSAAFFAGAHDYIDYDGLIRDLATNEIIGDARPKEGG